MIKTVSVISPRKLIDFVRRPCMMHLSTATLIGNCIFPIHIGHDTMELISHQETIGWVRETVCVLSLSLFELLWLMNIMQRGHNTITNAITERKERERRERSAVITTTRFIDKSSLSLSLSFCHWVARFCRRKSGRTKRFFSPLFVGLWPTSFNWQLMDLHLSATTKEIGLPLTVVYSENESILSIRISTPVAVRCSYDWFWTNRSFSH